MSSGGNDPRSGTHPRLAIANDGLEPAKAPLLRARVRHALLTHQQRLVTDRAHDLATERAVWIAALLTLSQRIKRDRR